jgi:hypothetical protein
MSREQHEQGTQGIGRGGRVKPECLATSVKDDGHTFVQRTHDFVRYGRQDGAGLDRLTLGIVPRLPETGEQEQSTVTRMDEVRLLAVGA